MIAFYLKRVMVVVLLLYNCQAFAQRKPVLIETALKKVTQTFGTQFVYSQQAIKDKTTLYPLDDLSNKTVEEILKGVLYPNNLLFLYISNNYYSVVPAEELAKRNNLPQPNDPSLPHGDGIVPSDPGNRDAIVISGKITTEEGSPMNGVSILVKNSRTGANTNSAGDFSINASPRDVLIFSFIGYETQEVAVANKRTINIVLKSRPARLAEVVVLGYTSVEREKVLGSVSSIKADDIVQATPTSTFDAIQGKLAGVQVLTNGGPGAGFDIRVRGISTFGSGTSPLYVVDGQQLDNIDNLDPNSIASLEVLKDGATAAAYGSKAANGVVLITTKSGKKNEFYVDVLSTTGFNKLVGDIRVANTKQRILYERLRQANVNALTTQELDSLSLLNRNSHNLQKLITRTAIRHQVNVGVRGGGDKGIFYWNTGALNESGVVMNSSYKRYNSLLKLDMTISGKLKIGTKINASYEEQDGLQEAPVFQQLVERIPYYPIFEPNGTYTRELFGRQNPLAETKKTLLTRDYRAQLFSYGQYEVLPNLTLRSTFGLNYWQTKLNDFSPLITQNPSTPIPTGRERFALSYDIQQENYFNYKNSWGRHHLGAFGGMQVQKYYVENFDIRANFISDVIPTFNNIDPSSLAVLEGLNSRHNMFSLFGGFNYDFANKYLLGATLRRDGSSRFGANRKFGYFPSATLGWRVSNEEFLRRIQFINNLLLRLSVGATGNERIGNYDYLGTFLPGAFYNGVNGVYPIRLANPNLSWESTTSSDLGLDLGLLNNRFNLSIDVWYKKTTNLLADVPLPKETGFNSIRKNVGSVDNKGVDITLRGAFFKTKDFTWNSSFNISFQQNKVTSLEGGTPFEVGAYRIAEGQPIGNIYGFKNLGIYQYDESNAYTPDGGRLTPNFDHQGNFVNYTHNGSIYTGTIRQMKNTGQILQGGDIIWEDVDKNFDITAADRQILGNGLADYFGGLTSEITYKRFSFSFLFDFNFGGEIYRRWDEARNDLNNAGETPGPDRIEGAWRNPGDITVYPRLFRVTQNREMPNSFFITSGDYVKWRYVRLNYDMPQKFLGKVKFINNLSFNIAVNNVLTWTEYIGYNPELGNRGNPLTPGLDDLRYPNDREIIVGAKIQFK